MLKSRAYKIVDHQFVNWEHEIEGNEGKIYLADPYCKGVNGAAYSAGNVNFRG